MRRAGWPGLTRALKEAVAPDSRETAPSPTPRPHLVAISNSLQPTGLRGPAPSPPKPGLWASVPCPPPLSSLPSAPFSLPHPQLLDEYVGFLGVVQRLKHPEGPNQWWGWGEAELPRLWDPLFNPPCPFPLLFPLATPSQNQAQWRGQMEGRDVF